MFRSTNHHRSRTGILHPLRYAVTALGTTALVTLSLSTIGVTAASASTVISTTPGTYDEIVPAGVTSVVITVVGGTGGNDTAFNGPGVTLGGEGAVVTATETVTPGEELVLVVASNGGNGTGAGGLGGAGYGAGGNGGPGCSGGCSTAAGGGGASAVYPSGNDSFLLVAGGGGGEGGSANGGDAGSNGVTSDSFCTAGTAGTISKAGDPGTCTGELTDAIAATGGDGTTGGTGGQVGDLGGGGGGGGYYGGGGASWAGGGGGSSYPAGDVTGSDSTATPSVKLVYASPSPVVTAGAAVTYTEGGSAVFLDPGLTVTDPSGTIASATVTIASGFQPGDALNFVATASITGSYISGTGVLVLNGSDSVTDYQAALDSVTYSFASNADPTGGGTDTSRTIDWSVTDSNDLGSNTDTSTVGVADGQCAPRSEEHTSELQSQ